MTLTISISPTSANLYSYQSPSQTLTVSVSGGTSPYTYQWYLNGVAISAATSSSYTFILSNSMVGGESQFTFYCEVFDSSSPQESGNSPNSVLSLFGTVLVYFGESNNPISEILAFGLSDLLSMTEQFSFSFLKELTDAISVISDSLSFSFVRSLSETVSIEEIFGFILKREISESISLIDLSLNKETIKRVLESFTLLEQIHFSAFRAFNEALSPIVDFFANAYIYIKVLEKITPQEQINFSLLHTIFESISPAEFIAFISRREFMEDIIPNDLSMQFEVIRKLFDLFVPEETIKFAFSRFFSEEINISESKNFSQIVHLLEQIDITDLRSLFSIIREQSDSLFPFEVFTFNMSFYLSLIYALNLVGISDVVLLKDIKTVDYYRETPLIIIPKNVEVETVFNGYIYNYNFELIAGSPDAQQFKQFLSILNKFIQQYPKNETVFLFRVNSQQYDTNVRGFYREFFEITAKVFIPLSS
jgi:hypothetical protein